MKREIKFRAWSKDLSEYRKLDDFSNHQGLGMGFEVQKGIGSNVTSIYHSINDVVEQYTDLTDANGNKIFEGDIVVVVSQYWGQLRNRYEVKFEQGAFYAGYSLLSKIAPSISVIGNIHENPELLEEEK